MRFFRLTWAIPETALGAQLINARHGCDHDAYTPCTLVAYRYLHMAEYFDMYRAIIDGMTWFPVAGERLLEWVLAF
jgi:hypothetical protein